MGIEEKKERLKDLAGNEAFISGIYNYCDRWCERCTLRSRCLSFSMDPELRTGEPSGEDLKSKEFWGVIHENFQVALELLYESAEKWGIDLNAVEDSEVEEREARRERVVERSPLAREARTYAAAVDEWMERHAEYFSERSRQIEREVEMELPGHDPIPGALALHDAVDVVRWYQYFLYPKISRALMGLEEPDRDRIDDVLGSVKIVLIAVERSLGAWQEVGDQLGVQDDALDMQIRLAKIRAGLELLVPDAAAFRRPGFDR